MFSKILPGDPLGLEGVDPLDLVGVDPLGLLGVSCLFYILGGYSGTTPQKLQLSKKDLSYFLV